MTAKDKKIGKHYAGPTWESNDGSKVVGEVKANDDGPDATAIPWLLLSAKATSGQGVFSPVKSIQRLYTSGGKAPAAGCDAAHTGQEARVAYKARYKDRGVSGRERLEFQAREAGAAERRIVTATRSTMNRI